MGLFEKRRRATDLEPVDTWDGDEDAAADIMIDLARTEPVPVVSRDRAPAPSVHDSNDHYDPTGPPVEVPAHIGHDDLVTVGEHPAGVDDRGERHWSVTLPSPVPAQSERKASSSTE